MGTDDRNIHGSLPSSSHACKPTSTPHYISHSALSLCIPHSLSSHADTSDAHDTPDTGLSPFDDRKVSEPFSLFLPYALSLPSLSQNTLRIPDSYTRVHRLLLHVRTPTTTLSLLPTSRTHTSSTHLTQKQQKRGKCPSLELRLAFRLRPSHQPPHLRHLFHHHLLPPSPSTPAPAHSSNSATTPKNPSASAMPIAVTPS